MGARGGSGIEIDVSHVPQRETGMTPYEIMLSESQERMLLVVKKGREAEVEAIFEKWDLHAAHIGDVTDDGLLRVKDPRRPSSPRFRTPRWSTRRRSTTGRRQRPAYLDDVQQLDVATLSRDGAGRRDALLALLASPTIASKRWVYRQYDHMVRTNTLVLAGMGAGRRARQGHGARAGDVDRRQRPLLLSRSRGAARCWRSPRRRATSPARAPSRSARTNCLNFGNPERPEIMWQLVEAVEGIAEACRALDVPITGGNVSLYNETDGKAIYPTPIIGVVGLIEDAARAVSRTFKAAGDAIVLLGESFGELGGSEYLKTVHGLVQGQPPRARPGRGARADRAADAGGGGGLLQSAHDCSDGGLAVTLAECAFDTGGIGFDVDVPRRRRRAPAVRHAFGESASRVVVAVRPANLQTLLQLAAEPGVPAGSIGTTGRRAD